MKKRRNLSKTGYVGVYRKPGSSKYYFSSSLNSDMLATTKRVRQYGYNSAKEAYEAKIEYEIKTKHEVAIGYNKNRLGYLVNKFLQHRRTIVKGSTFKHLQDMLSKYLILPYKDLTIEEFCRLSSLDNFRNKIVSYPFSRYYRNKILGSVRKVFEYGGLINYVKPEYVNLVIVKTAYIMRDPKEAPVNAKENYWSLEEWKKFLKTFKDNDPWKMFFTLYGQLGARVGEMRGLMNKHVDLTNGIIKIEQQAQTGIEKGKTVITSPKTSSSIRDVSIADSVRDDLEIYMKVYECENPDYFLFFNQKDPIATSTIRRKFSEHIKMAKLPKITLHGIRHSNCTWLLSDKLEPQDIGQISKRLGHASTKMTLDVYMHIHKKTSEVIVKKLNDIR